MLTPEQLAELVNNSDVLKLWQQVEEDTLSDMARRINTSQMGTMTTTAQWQAYRLEQSRLFRADLVKRLAQMTGQSQTAVRDMLAQAGTETLLADNAVYQAAGKDPPPLNDSATLLNLLNAGAAQTNGTFKNLTATTANTATRQFEDALDQAWLRVSSGAFDYQTAVRRTVAVLAAKGLEAITYPSGHKDTLEVAVRRAVITGVNQTCGKLQMTRMDQMGCEFVEVTAHVGARPTHAEWQGRVYHRGGAVTYMGVHYEDFVSATGYGSGDGLCGWNCRHNFYPFYPGLSERVYSDARLAELNARNVPYNGQMYTRYEINQMQRAMERKVRKYKRQYLCENAAGLDSTQTAVKLSNARKQLNEFASATGGRVDSARTGVNGLGHSQASSATWSARKEVEKYSKIRYHKDGTIVVTDDWKDKKKPSIPRTYQPNAVIETQTKYSNGKIQVDRTIYDSEGVMWIQIHSGPHNRLDKHPYGQNGEHGHTYMWNADGTISNRDPRELTEQERREHADIFGGEADG